MSWCMQSEYSINLYIRCNIFSKRYEIIIYINIAWISTSTTADTCRRWASWQQVMDIIVLNQYTVTAAHPDSTNSWSCGWTSAHLMNFITVNHNMFTCVSIRKTSTPVYDNSELFEVVYQAILDCDMIGPPDKPNTPTVGIGSV